MPETRDVFSQIGTDSGQNRAELTVKLKDKTERKKSQTTVARELRAWGAGLPGINFSVTEQSIIDQTSIDGSKALIINVRGPDRSVIAEMAGRLETIVKSTPGAVDVDNSMRSRRTELSVRIDRVALSQYGILVSDAALALRTALAGTNAGILRTLGRRVRHRPALPTGAGEDSAGHRLDPHRQSRRACRYPFRRSRPSAGTTRRAS